MKGTETSRATSLPPTYADLIRNERAKLESVVAILRDYEESVRSNFQDLFESSGGCARCGGRGWIVKWDTVGSTTGSYAEFADCPERGCTHATRTASGLAPYHTRYDVIRGIPNPIRTSVAWHLVADDIEEDRALLEANVAELFEEARLTLGDDAIIVHGSPLSVGLRGKVVWVGTNGELGRVGIACHDGIEYLPSKCAEKVLPNHLLKKLGSR